MANFRAYNGIFLKCEENIGPIKKGQDVQLLLDRWGTCAFVGINFVVGLPDIGKHFSPVRSIKKDETYK